VTTRPVNLRTHEYDIYIGRAGHGRDGYFGNPVRLKEICQYCNNLHLEPESTIPCYRIYLVQRVKEDKEFRRRVKELHGCRLGCFCKPRKCHGDYLSLMVEHLNKGRDV